MSDYLTQCVLEAKKAGLSYGQYMSTINSKAIKTHKKHLPKDEEKKPIVKVCRNCGKEFTIMHDYGNKYCSHECYVRANDRMALERYHKRRMEKLGK